MNSEFFAALEELEKKRGIPQDYMIEKIEAALVAAYKKEHALPIFDGNRENELIKTNSELISDPIVREYYIDFLKNNMK